MARLINLVKRFRDFFDPIGLFYTSIVSRMEYRCQRFTGVNERPFEFCFAFKHLSMAWPKTVLDVGTGKTALPHLMRTCGFLVTAIDNIQDFWPKGMVNRHYYVINDNINNTNLNKRFDFITCISVLEHIVEYESAVKSMFSLLNPCGTLILTFPYNEERYVKNVYELPDSEVEEKPPFICQSFSRIELDKWLMDNNGRLIEQEFLQFYTGEYWTCGDALQRPVRVNKDEPHQISCVCIKKA